MTAVVIVDDWSQIIIFSVLFVTPCVSLGLIGELIFVAIAGSCFE